MSVQYSDTGHSARWHLADNALRDLEAIECRVKELWAARWNDSTNEQILERQKAVQIFNGVLRACRQLHRKSMSLETFAAKSHQQRLHLESAPASVSN
jgi:hypothetical protein